MALTDLPEGSQVVGRVEIVLYLEGDGVGTAYGLEGMSPEAAIGYLTVVSDRIREERRLNWDTCPGCGLPWGDHFEEDEEDDEDDDEDDDELEEAE